MQKTSLLSHHTSSESEGSDVEQGKLMKNKKRKKSFTVGDSEGEDDDEGVTGNRI